MIGPFHGLRVKLFAAALALAAASLTTGAFGATQETEFEKGQQLYANGQHVQADDFLRKAIDSVTPTITDSVLVARARMIVAASDMYLGRKADAIVQFEIILKLNPKFEPDALVFPPGVLDEFRKTRERLAKEAFDKAAGDKTAQELAASKADFLKLAARYDALKIYASSERVVTRHSRVIASLPFGIGQFQNGDTALGVIFLSTEVLAVTTAAIAFGVHEQIPRDPGDVTKARSNEATSRVVNWISASSFFALAIGGIVQANLAFVGESYESRARVLPKSFLRIEPMLVPTAGGATFGITGVF